MAVRLRSAFDVAILAALSVGGLLATIRLSAVPNTSADGLAVIFAPWTDAPTALTRAVGAGGRFVRFGGASFVVVTIPDDSGYAARSYAAGAWLVLDPKLLAACFSPERENL